MVEGIVIDKPLDTAQTFDLYFRGSVMGDVLLGGVNNTLIVLDWFVLEGNAINPCDPDRRTQMVFAVYLDGERNEPVIAALNDLLIQINTALEAMELRKFDDVHAFPSLAEGGDIFKGLRIQGGTMVDDSGGLAYYVDSASWFNAG